MTQDELVELNKKIYMMLDEEFFKLMEKRVERLKERRIFLGGLLRYFKIRREYRKLSRIRKLCTK